MKNMKKLLAVLLAMTMLIVLAGCGGKDSAELERPEGEVSFPKTLSIFCRNGGSMLDGMKDYNEIEAFRLLEEATGTHIEWDIPTAVGFEEKFNLLIASGNYPDIIVADWIKRGISQYITDDVILDISPYVKDYMPNLAAFSKANPYLARQYIQDGGKIYSAPYIRQDTKLNIFCGPVMRTDWVEKLGLEIPTNAEELYTVLKAFKTQDPNGNGKADEIPMAARGDGADLGVEGLLHMFGTKNDFYVKDGKVRYGVMEPEFEEGLKYIAKLFNEGLIDPDYILLNRTEMTAKITSEVAGFAFDFQPTNVMNTFAQSNPNAKYAGIPILKGKDGVKRAMFAAYTNSIYDCAGAISTHSKDPFGAMKWLDFLYSEEGHMIMNFGVEGDTYEMKDGIPTFTDKINNNKDGLNRSQVWGANFGTFNSYFPARQDWYSYSQYLSEYGLSAIETWADGVVTDYNLPPLEFNTEDKETITDKYTPIDTYVDEQINKIIMGQEDISKLSAIRAEVEKRGIADVLKIYQKEYDVYNKKDIGF